MADAIDESLNNLADSLDSFASQIRGKTGTTTMAKVVDPVQTQSSSNMYAYAACGALVAAAYALYQRNKNKKDIANDDEYETLVVESEFEQM